MEYSAVIHPPMTFCSFIQRGTFSSTVTPQITRVLPHSIKVEPVAYGAMPFRKRSGRNWFTARPSARKEGTADCDSDIDAGDVKRESPDGNEEIRDDCGIPGYKER